MAGMADTPQRILFRSAWSRERVEAAHAFAAAFAPSAQMLVVGHSRDAADDFVRGLATAKGATFGLHRFSLPQLVAYLAQNELGRLSLSPATRLATEAVIARATFGLLESGAMPYLKRVASFPGFSMAAASTLADVRGAGVSSEELRSVPVHGPDLSELLEAFEARLNQHGLADSADVYGIASAAVREGRTSPTTSHPLLLLDPVITTHAEEEILSALLLAAPSVFVTVPESDRRTTEVFTRLGLSTVRGSGEAPSSLGRLRRYLFSEQKPPDSAWDDSVVFFSAPGEGRECVEVARAILREAEGGTKFDEIAILLRRPQSYSAHLESAMRRAGIPLFVARGAKRPSPTGRAFLALLACAAENLSARRFAEYLSLGQVPDATKNVTTTSDTWRPSEDDLLSAGSRGVADQNAPDDDVYDAIPRAPRRWERLLVEAAVVGVDGHADPGKFDGRGRGHHLDFFGEGA